MENSEKTKQIGVKQAASPITLSELNKAIIENNSMLLEEIREMTGNIQGTDRERLGKKLGNGREIIGKQQGNSWKASDTENQVMVFEDQNYDMQQVIYLCDQFNDYVKELSKFNKHNTKIKIEKYTKEFRFYIKTQNYQAAKETIEQMNKHIAAGKQSRNNLPQVVAQNDEYFLKFCASILPILTDSRQVYRLSEKQVKSVNQLADSNIPDTFITNINKAGYRTDYDTKGKNQEYTFELVKRTAQAVLRQPKPQRSNKPIYIVLSTIVLIALITVPTYPVWIRLFSNAPHAVISAASQAATLVKIEVSNLEIETYIQSFKALGTSKAGVSLHDLPLKTFDDKFKFYQYYAPLAIAACKGTQLDARIPLTQAYRESGGHSLLFTGYRNILGIKKGTCKECESILYTTKEYKDGKLIEVNDYFRVYKTVYQCFNDYIEKMKGYPYKGILTEPDALKQCEYLKKYSTNPDYVKTLKIELQSFVLETSK